jgi:hypothetical protein
MFVHYLNFQQQKPLNIQHLSQLKFEKCDINSFLFNSTWPLQEYKISMPQIPTQLLAFIFKN